MEKKPTTKKTTTKKKPAPEKTEQPKVEKTEPKKVTYSDIRQATDDMINNFVRNISSVISAADSSTMTYDCNLEDVLGAPIKFLGYLTGIPRYDRVSYMLCAELRSEGIIFGRYSVTITPDMDMEQNLEVFSLNCTAEVINTLMWYLDVYPEEEELDGKNVESDNPCDACEMECPCRDNPLCDHEDDFDEDDDEFDNVMPYDTIDGTEIYALADDMIYSDANYAQHGYALLGVKNQYTVILYGKNTVADKIVIKCTMLASDNVTMQVNRYGVAYTIPCDDVLSDNVTKICAKHGYDLIHNMLELVKEHDDEIVDGSIMAAESADEIEDRICNNPDFAE